MIEVGLMIEGQDGVTWDRWQRLARVVEASGYSGLYRSDHFTNPSGPHLAALELWSSLTWLATNTKGISFGPLVAPVSFRDPRIMAWQAAAVHGLAPGRLRFGLGAGWMEREHKEFGFALLDVDARFRRFEEALQIAVLLTREQGPAAFEGEFYRLNDAEFVPNPVTAGKLPIVIGGNGLRRTLPLAARYADEWNGVNIPLQDFQQRNTALDEMARAAGRNPQDIHRTLMTRVIFGKDQAELESRLQGEDAGELRAAGHVIGTPREIPDQLQAMESAGVQGVMLQWLDDLDDLDGIAALGKAASGRE